MSADKNSIERTKCSHCFSVVEFECGTQKVRCNKCNTLIKIERKSIEELSAKALEGIRERTQNQRINHTSGDDVSKGKKYITSTKNSENTRSIHLPADKIVICLTCSTESRIKPDLGKYRCPNCTRLLVYVKDAVSAHYVGAKEQSKRNRAKHLRQNKLSPQNKEEKQNKGRCLNCGQMLNTSSSKEICPACNTKVNLGSDFRPSEDKPKAKTNSKETSNRSVCRTESYGLFENIIWFVKSLILVSGIWTISMSFGMAIIDEVDQTAGIIVMGTLFFGTMYFCSTLDGLVGPPPSNDHYSEEFMFAFVFIWLMFGPAIGGLCGYYLFWS